MDGRPLPENALLAPPAGRRARAVASRVGARPPERREVDRGAGAHRRRHLRVYRQPAIEPLIQSDHSLSCCCSVARSLFDVDRAAHAHSHRTPPACSERSSRTSQMPAIANTEHYEIRRLVRRRHRSCRHRTRQNRHCARPAVQCRDDQTTRPARTRPRRVAFKSMIPTRMADSKSPSTLCTRLLIRW
jgi:hypothetical protein